MQKNTNFIASFHRVRIKNRARVFTQGPFLLNNHLTLYYIQRFKTVSFPTKIVESRG